jgi:alpha-glucoside transport system substrate-binding protein
MQSLAKDGKLVARDDLKAQVESDNGKDWVTYGSGLDGKFYAPPLGANLKSLVWYSPKQFKAKGYTVPKTYDEMIALSDKIVAAGGKPWCAGIESGGATGWPATDWMEEVMLKQFGPQDYDAWVNNTLKFNDPKVKQAADTVAKILLNDKYMKGGVKSVATTSFQDGGLGVLDGSCFMHKQANFYANQWPQGTNVGPDGDVSTFPFPAINSQYANAVEGGGEVIGEFRDAPEVRAVVNYLTSVDFAKSRAAIGSWLTSNKKLDTSVYTNAQEKLFADQLKNASIFRFDASDLMPAAVGAGTFWKEMTAWIGQGKDTQKVLDDIQASWPKS